MLTELRPQDCIIYSCYDRGLHSWKICTTAKRLRKITTADPELASANQRALKVLNELQILPKNPAESLERANYFVTIAPIRSRYVTKST